ncbi:hypothetical protein DV515_00006450, partial [Chloebia gouldiae]
MTEQIQVAEPPAGSPKGFAKVQELFEQTQSIYGFVDKAQESCSCGSGEPGWITEDLKQSPAKFQAKSVSIATASALLSHEKEKKAAITKQEKITAHLIAGEE